MAIVYRYRRNDTNEIFYIGIGKSIKRAYEKNLSRNKYWKNITNKTSYTVEILKENITWEDACELECLLISEYGRKILNTGYLVNITEGGEGSKGFKHTKKFKKELSKRMKGNKLSKETKLKIGKANSKNNHSKEHIEKLRQINLGKKLSKNHLKKLSIPVLQLTLKNKIINKFKSMREASLFTNTILSNISRVCKGERKSANGFKWRYYDY